VSTPERVDPRDAEALDAWYDVYRPALDDDRPYAVAWTREEVRAVLLRESEYSADEIWGVRDDAGNLVGALALRLPLKDNAFAIVPSIAVRKDARRQGYGTALARTVEERAKEFGRTVVQGQLDVPFEGETAGQAFARANGLEPANIEVHRILELPLDKGFLERLAREAAERHQGYELVSWQDRCPDDLVDAYAALLGIFVTEAPQGDLQKESELWDAARVRWAEERNLAQGRNTWNTVAVALDGALAGHTDLHVGRHDPANAFQWGTLVSPAHRGHRLGLALKVRNYQELQRSHPEPLVVHTWNGEQNTAMNAVNARLGFRPVELLHEVQRKG
jgi:GNAT superfamily N-acetyltransferase